MTNTRLTPNDIKVIERVSPNHTFTGRKRLLGRAHLVALVAADLREGDRFHATMNGGAATPEQRADAIVRRYFASTAAQRDAATATLLRIRSELGI